MRDAPFLLLLGRWRLVLALAERGEHEEGEQHKHADHDQVGYMLPHVVLLVANVTGKPFYSSPIPMSPHVALAVCVAFAGQKLVTLGVETG